MSVIWRKSAFCFMCRVEQVFGVIRNPLKDLPANFLVGDDFLHIILKANVKKCLKEPFEKSICYVFVFLL